MAETVEVWELDAGVVIRATLAFTEDFDPDGAEAVLEVDVTEDPRPMTLVGNVATYEIPLGEFAVGSHKAIVRVTKGAVSLGSDEFKIKVKREP